MSEVDEYARLRDRLAAAVCAICPAWLRDQQEDIVQAAMMALLRQRETTRRRFSFSYLKKCAFTALVDEIRRLRRRGEVPLETGDGELALIAGSATPERRCLASEIGVAVRACLQELAPPRRLAVTLHLLAYKVPEIAEKTGWPRKRAENLVFRGMQDLRECLRGRELVP